MKVDADGSAVSPAAPALQHQRAGLAHLQTRAQFQAVLAGSVLARSPHFVLHGVLLDSPVALFQASPVWIGVVTAKRWARRAVTRNAIRRQVYAVATDLVAQLPCAALLVRLRVGFDRKRFVSATSFALRQTVRAELLQLLTRAARHRPAQG